MGDHTETIEIDYDPTLISYRDLLDVFWSEHDARRPAHSVQYRSAIFYRSDDQRRTAEESKARIESAIGPVTTALEPLRCFYRAEDYHQKYVWKHDHRLLASLPLAGDSSMWAVASARGVSTPV